MVSRLAYRDQSRAYLEQANEELARDDLRQASEKGWGAASQIVKAVAEEREWEHNGHWELHNVASLSRIHRWTGMDGVRTSEGGEGVTGAMIRARIWVDGR